MAQPSSKEKVLLQTLKTILKPLVRLLIQQNITYSGLQNLLKQTYVKVADDNFKLKGKRQTDSRISLLTGVHRADVKRIRSQEENEINRKAIKASLSAQIMSIWTGHHLYLCEKGIPCSLFRYKQDGSPSFEALVLSISKDKHPRSFIDEWLHQGIVELSVKKNKEMISLSEKGYVPEADFEEKLFFAGKNIGDHLAVVVNNLENHTPPMFDRAVYYSALSEDSVKTLEILSKKEMMKVLIKINQRANQLQEQDKKTNNAIQEMHVGAYYYRKIQKVEK
jgi:hypothetical protein